MTLLEHMRNYIFWIIDYIKGRPVKKAVINLENCEDGLWSEKHVKDYQFLQIQKLLQHAKSTVPFYKKQNNLDLNNWPVVNKNILRKNDSNVLSKKFQKSKLITMTTSGSTGTPFVCWQNKNKKKHVNAEMIFYNGKIGYFVGRRIIYLRSIVNEIKKNKLQEFVQNIYQIDCTDLSDAGIKEKLNQIAFYSKGCGAMLMGYASTFKAFQEYFDKYGVEDAKKAYIYGIVSGSEILYDVTRKSIEKAFNCKCVSRYANEENGFLGQDYNENNIFSVNRANYFIEILKMDQDIPADENEVGRIVVTDLYNYAMPMIRYDTGDVGTYTKKYINGIERLVIGSFGGRIVDSVRNTEGDLVSPHSITNLMWKYTNIRQFQFIQKKESCNYELILNVGDSVIDEKTILNDLKKIFGNKAVITIKYCDDILVLASGKRRYIVNENSD